MPLFEPFKKIPESVAEWNRFLRELTVAPDDNQVTESTISNGSVTPAKLSESYYTESEIDALNYTKTELDAGQLDNRYYTESEVNALLSDKESTGTYTGTLTGLTTTETETIRYDRSHNLITLYIPLFGAVSNATTMTITGGSSGMSPTRAQRLPFIIKDNNVIQLGLIEIGIDGVLTFYSDLTGAVFTNSGNKGVELQSITYSNN